MKKKSITNIIDKMYEMFPANKTELEYSTPFQLLIAVILSAQSTDKQVNKITKLLFQTIITPDDIIRLWLGNFESSIKSIWLYKSKAKNIYNLSKMIILLWKNDLKTKKGQELYLKYWYVIPDDIEKLLELPWVWIKTAKVIWHILYGIKVVAVDTHVHRIMNRLGIVKTDKPEKTSDLLEKLIPNDYKSIAHNAMVLFGRYHCKAINPKCDICPFTDICEYFILIKW